jgi:hypothetical protein
MRNSGKVNSNHLLVNENHQQNLLWHSVDLIAANPAYQRIRFLATQLNGPSADQRTAL